MLLPDAEVAERTNDKYVTHLFLQERGIGSPASWLPDELPSDLPFPVLVKARRGFGSRNIFRAENREELDFFLARTPAESFVQEVCAGEEFSMDVFCDLEGRCLNAIPRTMIESKGGESIKGMTIADDELIVLGRDVSEALGVVGPATVQCFRAAPGDCRVTDVNLRFGGAFPLPLAAGSEYPALALALARGERPEPRVGEFREGVVMTRFFSETCLVRGAGRHALAVVAVGLLAPAIPFSPGSGWFISIAFVSPRRLCCWPRSSWAPRPATARATSPWERTRLSTPPRRAPRPSPPPPGHCCPRRGRGYGQGGRGELALSPAAPR